MINGESLRPLPPIPDPIPISRDLPTIADLADNASSAVDAETPRDWDHTVRTRSSGKASAVHSRPLRPVLGGVPHMSGIGERFGQSGVLRTPGAARSPTRTSVGVNATWGRPDMSGTHERFGQSGVCALRVLRGAPLGHRWGRTLRGAGPTCRALTNDPHKSRGTSVPWVSPSSATPNAGSGTGTQSGQRHPMRYLARRVVAVANRRE